MSLYGSSMAQSLGQGTFIFDKIYPNRYLLDTNKDVDGVLIGRYALVEYDRPLAVVKNLPTTYREENGTISRHYDIIKKLVLNTNTNNFEFADNTLQIFVCKAVIGDDNKYEYHYTAIPGDGQNSFGTWEKLGEFTPFEFNSKLDKLHATSDDNDEENEMVYSGYAGWDSTAWVKTVAENKLKYVKVADLNVLTPTFTVLPSSDTNSEPGPITTFQVNEQNEVILDNNNPRQPIFNVPQYKQNENAQFNVRYPNPLNINIEFDTTTKNNNTDEIVVSYGPNSKTYNVTLGKYATGIDNIDTRLENVADRIEDINGFIQNGNWPSQSSEKPSYTVDNANTIPTNAGSLWQVIKETYAAAKAANAAANLVTSEIEDIFTNESIIIDWEAEEPSSTETQVIIPIENKPNTLTALGIEELYGNASENLLIGSGFSQIDYANMAKYDDTSDWTKYIRWYGTNIGTGENAAGNSKKDQHTFNNEIDTIKLSDLKGYTGIVFVRKATDINLDSTSQYTLSCEAKTTKNVSANSSKLQFTFSYFTKENNNSYTFHRIDDTDHRKTFQESNTWETFSYSFTPAPNTEYICYGFTMYGVPSGNDTFSIRHCKLEKGSTATQWFLNPEDENYGLH